MALVEVDASNQRAYNYCRATLTIIVDHSYGRIGLIWV